MNHKYTFNHKYMKKVILVLFIMVSLSSCTDNDKAKKVLSESGYTNIELTGHTFCACSEDDSFSTGFTATSPNGTKVKGTVCSGWLKGATIRFK